MSRRLFALLGALLALAAPPVAAHAPEPYHMTVQAGPYPVEVGFSDWPIAAERSIDITFMPEGGIEGKTAAIAVTGPEGVQRRLRGDLGRHPRQRERWGLDLIALAPEGDWTIDLTVDGPLGEGTAAIGPIPVGPRPGPPPLPFWLLGTAPAFAVVALVVVGWRRVRPAATPEARSWG